MDFFKPEYWSGEPFPSSGNLPNRGIEPRSPALQADSLSAKPPEKPQNTGVGSLSLLQQTFPTQESNRGFLHCRQILYQLSYQGSPLNVKNNLNISLLILDSMEFMLCLLLLYLCNEIERTLTEYFSKTKTNGIWEKKCRKRNAFKEICNSTSKLQSLCSRSRYRELYMFSEDLLSTLLKYSMQIGPL